MKLHYAILGALLTGGCSHLHEPQDHAAEAESYIDAELAQTSDLRSPLKTYARALDGALNARGDGALRKEIETIAGAEACMGSLQQSSSESEVRQTVSHMLTDHPERKQQYLRYLVAYSKVPVRESNLHSCDLF